MAALGPALSKASANRMNHLLQKVEEGLRQVHWSFIMDDHIGTVFDWVEFKEDSLADTKLFTAMCCVAGRVLKLHHKYISETHH